MVVLIKYILLVVFVVFIKEMILLLSMPWLSLYSFLKRRKAYGCIKGTISDIPNGNKWTPARIRRCIINYADGYYRLCIYWTGKIPSHHIRSFFYKYAFLIRAEKNSVIYYGAEVRAPYLLQIGKGTVIGDRCTIDARRGRLSENLM